MTQTDSSFSAETDGHSVAPIPEDIFRRILALTDSGRSLDAYHLGLQFGPIELWPGAETKLLSARLARHLGGNALAWRLATEAYRQKPNLARFLTGRIYALTDRRGVFSAWRMARRFDRCESETPLEKAEALICRGILSVVFRDFETAHADLAEAQALAPSSPWVWSECSALWAEQGRHDTALEYVDYALALQPFFRPAIQRKAEYLQTLRRDDEALQLLESSRQSVQNYGLILQLITIRSERENWAELLPLLDEARRLAPLAEEGLEVFLAMKEADARLGLGDREGAAAAAEKATKMKFYENLALNLRKAPADGRRVKIPVPYIHQDYNTCAPATLSAITAFWDRPIPQETIIGEICYDGTTDFAERRWVEKNGWHTREFKVTWEVATALLDLGIPFILSTSEIDSGHAQAVIGYDTLRQSLLIRDPGMRHHREVSYKEFTVHYEPVGPRGLLVLPAEKAALIDGIHFPESDLYDLHYQINCALDEYDRPRAEAALLELEKQAPGQRLSWMGRRALASYDQNPAAHLEAVDQLRALYPDDDRLISARIGLLRLLGRNKEILEMLRERFAKPNIPSLFWLEYVNEVNRDAPRSNFAMRLAQRSLKHNPRNIGGLGALAANLWNTRQHREIGVTVQRLAVTLGDKKENVAQVYFQMLLGLGRSQEGLDYLHRRATSLLDRSSAPSLTYAQALDHLNRTQEAREALQVVLQHRPQDGDLLLHLAQFEACAGQTDYAFKLLAAAAPHSLPGLWQRNAARLHRRAGDYEQSLSQWITVAESSPLDLEAQREIALLLARKNGRNAGEEYIQDLGRRFPLHVGVLQLEIAWLKEGRSEETEHRLVEFVRGNPYNAWAQRELTLVHLKRETTAAVLDRAQFVRQIDPHNPDSWQVEAAVLERMNREGEARECLLQALTLRVDSDYSLRRLLMLSHTAEEKIEALRFVLQQIEQQQVVGPIINTYRETAFAILSMEELTENLRDICRKRPDRWEAWYSLSLHLLTSGNIDEAGQVALGAIERFPLLAVAWHHSGIVQGQQGQWNEAIDSFRRALQIEPEWTNPVHSLANAYRRQNRMSDALALFETAHRRNPLESTILGAWADLLWHSGQREEAIRHLQKAVDLNPEYHWGWTSLSRWSIAALHKDVALEACRERAQRLKQDAPAWLLVAQLASRPDQASEQLDAACRARESDPRLAAAHDMVAIGLARQRRYDEALTACQPADFGAHVPTMLRGREAWVLMQQGHADEALDSMMAVLRDEPQYYWGWEMVADWKLKKNDMDGALHAAECLVRLGPAAPQAYTLRAQIYTQTKKRDWAKKDFQRALALAPSSPAAGWQLLRMQLDDRENSQAEQTIARMQPHVSPGIILPAKIILAARLSKFNDALERFAEAALLPEIDVSALQEAVGLLDKLGQGDPLNTTLGSVMKQPSLNPVFAALWVVRRGRHFSWQLLPQLKKISPDTRVQEAFLEQWLIESRKLGKGLDTARLIQKSCPELARRSTAVWGNIGNVLTRHSLDKEAIAWLSDWSSRPEALGWMVTNLVFSLHAQHRTAEADAVSRELLKRGLRDHTTSYHLAYLAISALEKKAMPEARAYFADIHFEGKDATTNDYIRRMVKSTLAVQEAPAGPERKSAYRHESDRLKRAKRDLKLTKQILEMEARVLKIISR